MSPTSYRLLYSAVWDCKGTNIFGNTKFSADLAKKEYLCFR